MIETYRNILSKGLVSLSPIKVDRASDFWTLPRGSDSNSSWLPLTVAAAIAMESRKRNHIKSPTNPAMKTQTVMQNDAK